MDNVSKIFSAIGAFRNQPSQGSFTNEYEGANIEQLPNPGLGNASRAFKVNPIQGDPSPFYVVDFLKKEFFVTLQMKPARLDYKEFEETARKAADKL